MAAPSTQSANVGFRNVRIYQLNAAGVPAATSPAPYEGRVISAAKALTVNHPEARRVTHFGDDFVFLIDRLPPTETVSGELRTGKLDLTVDSLLSNVNQYTVGEARGMNVATDQQGFEPLVGLLAYQQGEQGDASLSLYGARVWNSIIFPQTWLILRQQGLSEAIYEPQYAIFPQLNTKHLWGLPYTTATEGDTIGQIERWITVGVPLVVAWRSDNDTEIEFKFSTAHLPTSTAKVHAVSLYAAASGTVTDIFATCTITATGITPPAGIEAGDTQREGTLHFRVAARVAGRPAPPAFRYKDKGTMATVGPRKAVVNAFGLQVGGLKSAEGGIKGVAMWAPRHLKEGFKFAGRGRIVPEHQVELPPCTQATDKHQDARE